MWAVYVYVVEEGADDPTHFDDVERRAAELGYGSLHGTYDLACDPGASTLLGLDPETAYSAAALFFDHEQDAQIVAGAFEPFTVGYGRVEIGCND